MLWVKFESIYTETDRFGNQRRWENRLEASGEHFEVRGLLDDLMKKSRLPGLTSINMLNQNSNSLQNFYEDDEY